MEKFRTSAVPCRATIVMDSNILMALSCPIPPEHRGSKAESPRNYLGILPFLARNGYRIIIPEMISVEVAQVLADGTNMNHIFPVGKYADRLISQPFLCAVARGEFPNISIMPDTGPSTVDTYCKKLHALLDDSFLPKGKQHAADIRRALLTANAGKGKEMGDHAILYLLNTLRHDRNPVFVFTNDGMLADRFPQSVKKVTLREFMHHLQDAGLAEAAGLSGDAGPDAMTLHMLDQRPQEGKLRLHEKSFLPESTVNFVRNLHSHPSRFLKTLQTVKADIDAAPVQEAPDASSQYRTAAGRRAAQFSGLNLRGK